LNINIDNININYNLDGDGEYVVLLHGWGSSIKLFEGMTNILKTKYKVLAPDMPGFGDSDEPPVSWNVSDYAEFIIKFLEKFNVKSAVFLGHSFGGRVIFKLFERSDLPFHIKKVILVDSAGVKPKKTIVQKIKLYSYKASKQVLNLPPVKKFFPDALDNLRKSRGSADYNAASPVMRETLVKVVNEDLTHVFPKVNVPTLLVWGRNDTATPVSDAELMEKLIPDSGLVVLERSGHYSFIDEAYTFNRVLASFMNI